MGLMGRYIDSLPAEARDRLIQAQDWCVAAVRDANGARCLLGNAEDWRELPVEPIAWRAWMDDERGGPGPVPGAGGRGWDVDLLCRPELFAFRRARPADMAVYRGRLSRWGAASESRIGARFDRLCARRGMAGAVRMVKRRAGTAFASGRARDGAEGVRDGARGGGRRGGLTQPVASAILIASARREDARLSRLQ